MRTVVVSKLTHYNGSGVIAAVEVHVTSTGGGAILGVQATVRFAPSLERTGTAPRQGRSSRGRGRPIVAASETRPYKNWTLAELSRLKQAAISAAENDQQWPKHNGKARKAKIGRIEMNHITVTLE